MTIQPKLIVPVSRKRWVRGALVSVPEPSGDTCYCIHGFIGKALGLEDAEMESAGSLTSLDTLGPDARLDRIDLLGSAGLDWDALIDINDGPDADVVGVRAGAPGEREERELVELCAPFGIEFVFTDD